MFGMFGSSLHRETVTVALEVEGEPDADGVPTRTPGASLVLEGCNVQPVTTTQVIDGGVQVVTVYRVSAPGLGWGVRPNRLVSWRLAGPWYVQGDAIEFAGTGALDHTEFLIARTKG